MATTTDAERNAVLQAEADLFERLCEMADSASGMDDMDDGVLVGTELMLEGQAFPPEVGEMIWESLRISHLESAYALAPCSSFNIHMPDIDFWAC